MASYCNISLVIPHFNRFAFLLECVQGVLEHPRIDEICISDDCSTDGSYEKLQSWAETQPKVRLQQNTLNQDCYINKHQSVSMARNKWVILFDDDNVIGLDYVDVLCALPEWKENTVYCPEFARPHFDYRAFSGTMVTRHNVSSLMKSKHFPTVLNTANYFFSRDTYLYNWDGTVNPHTADSIYLAYRLLAAGKRLYVTPGLHYFHRVHDGSHFKRENYKTGKFAAEIETKLKSLR